MSKSAEEEAEQFDLIDEHVDLEIAVNTNYRHLVEAIGARLGMRRGWQRRAASILGVSPSLISQALSASVKARLSDDVLARAKRSLGIGMDFFVMGGDPEEVLDSEAGRRAMAAALLDPRDVATQSISQPPPSLVRAHRWLLATLDLDDPSTTLDDVSGGFDETMLSVPFIRSLLAANAPNISEAGKRRALARAQMEFGMEFRALRDWIVTNPRERTVGDD